MLGALVGDYIGSQYEFNSNNAKNHYKSMDDFPLFGNNYFTDDSMMTMAIAEALLKTNLDDLDVELLKKNTIECMVKWYKLEPNAGYGGRFHAWLRSNNRQPYNSYGNGAAMRISPVGWISRSEEEVKVLSKAVTEITHNHPEGMKGAEAIAMCIYLAKCGSSKEELLMRVKSEYYPNVDRFEYNDLVRTYRMDESCQGSVPQALYCFFSTDSFEECLRKSIFIGGDSDTIAAISCSIAEAFYKEIPAKMRDKVIESMPRTMFSILLNFKSELTK